MNDVSREDLDDMIEDAYSQTGGAREISYRDLLIVAPMNDVRQALQMIKDATPEGRETVKASVNHELDRWYDAIVEGEANDDDAMLFGQDVSIWFAFKIFEGEEPLEATWLN